jgi:catechol 2,3-dioxygenase
MTGDRHEATPVRVKKLGHVVLTVSDIERSTKFWTDIMGFEVSDKNEIGMVFLRNGPDHHTIALVPAKSSGAPREEGELGFHHCALEVATVSELFKIRDFLRARGVPIVYEGRRGPGGNPGIEFKDPDGFNIEIYSSMDQIGSDGQSRPAGEWRRAKTLEEAVANPLVGVTYR